MSLRFELVFLSLLLLVGTAPSKLRPPMMVGNPVDSRPAAGSLGSSGAEVGMGPVGWEPDELMLPTRWRCSMPGGAALWFVSMAASMVRVRGRKELLVRRLDEVEAEGGGGLESVLS
jgi:hypothetical protein